MPRRKREKRTTTPGPWIADCRRKEWFIKSRSTSELVAVLDRGPMSFGMDRHPRHDAHLIAAAPAMLQALQNIQTYLAVYGDPHSGTVKKCGAIAAGAIGLALEKEPTP